MPQGASYDTTLQGNAPVVLSYQTPTQTLSEPRLNPLPLQSSLLSQPINPSVNSGSDTTAQGQTLTLSSPAINTNQSVSSNAPVAFLEGYPQALANVGTSAAKFITTPVGFQQGGAPTAGGTFPSNYPTSL